MNTPINRQLILSAYAHDLPGDEHFSLRETVIPVPEDGQVLVKVVLLSMDPAPRMRMSGAIGGMPQLPLDTVMIGRGIGRVIESRHAQIPVGAAVMGELGWQEYACIAGDGLRVLDLSLGALPEHLGVLGNSGLAAYFAVRQGQVNAGETLVLNAAAGSVGSAAGQIARLHGARVIGIAGGDVQMRYLRDALGFDAAVDYQAADFPAQLAAVLPDGVDVFLDLVGGDTHDAVMRHLNVHARIVLIGTISNYNLAAGETDRGPRHLLTWINKRVRLSGFLVGDYAAEFPNAMRQLAAWLHDGSVKSRLTMFDGLTSCPQAFRALFGSQSVGKVLVMVEDSPHA
ncbi:MAG: NADP-dependent oxidoreductase [bacterium]|nr:NADP-dependent oxidoreductase [bacterium]